METKSNIKSLKAILYVIGIGIWIIVFQNAGIIPTKQTVFVKGGYIDADIIGSVNADINGTVSIDNTVDINIEAINGKSNAFYKDHDGDFMVLPVIIR